MTIRPRSEITRRAKWMSPQKCISAYIFCHSFIRSAIASRRRRPVTVLSSYSPIWNRSSSVSELSLRRSRINQERSTYSAVWMIDGISRIGGRLIERKVLIYLSVRKMQATLCMAANRHELLLKEGAIIICWVQKHEPSIWGSGNVGNWPLPKAMHNLLN